MSENDNNNLKIKIKWQKENITFWRVINFYGFLKKDE